ncbi:MAG: DUF3343 domain-containing protein [Oscillospiraceae bacterium]
MINYYLTCRSLTYAQRSSKALDAARISNSVTRTPSGMSREGCGYAVKIRAGTLTEALRTLRLAQLLPKKAFAVYEDGHTEEVPI